MSRIHLSPQQMFWMVRRNEDGSFTYDKSLEAYGMQRLRESGSVAEAMRCVRAKAGGHSSEQDRSD